MQVNAWSKARHGSRMLVEGAEQRWSEVEKVLPSFALVRSGKHTYFAYFHATSLDVSRCTDMAVSLGKRKRREVSTVESEHGELDDCDARALFQRAFEAKFQPLEVTEKLPSAPETVLLGDGFDPDDEESVISDWGGLSDDEAQVEIVKHDAMDAAGHQLAKQEQKAFMVSFILGKQFEPLLRISSHRNHPPRHHMRPRSQPRPRQQAQKTKPRPAT